MPTPVVVDLVVSRKRVLLVKRAEGWYPNMWGLPRGNIKHGEHVSGAAERELKEETGISAKFVSIQGLVSQHVLEKGTLTDHYIINVCKLKTTTLKFPDGNLKWFKLDRLDKHKADIVPSNFQIIMKMLDTDKSYFECLVELEDEKYVLKKFEPQF